MSDHPLVSVFAHILAEYSSELIIAWYSWKALTDCPEAHSFTPLLLLHLLYMSTGCMKGGFLNIRGKNNICVACNLLTIPSKAPNLPVGKVYIYYYNTVCNANLNPLLVKHINDALNERASKEATAQTRCCDCFSRQTHTSNVLMFYPPSNL